MKPEIIAKKLRDAQNTKTPIDPIRSDIGGTDIDLAYQIQTINTEHRVEGGARIVGKKIGLTSKVVQKQLGVDQPDFGVLFHDMEVLNGQSISIKEILQPKVEAEIAFVLGEDLDMEALTIVDVIDAIDYMLPSIEIVGSRIKAWDVKITDTVADNASASHYVLGHTPKTIDELDVVNTEMVMKINGEVQSQGKGAACLGSPLNALLWLAQKMQEMDEPLQAGEVILSGALGPFYDVKAGDQVTAEFTGLGSVSVSFSE